ncbi:CMD domain protein [Roseomonas sp. CCTCC AB2023176]|uniref:CMD domain protein n=1 Tax=Roseomonas sp. CCTCC AB2023176 TaxID=3342640 RepID=UPI0035D8A6C0
MSDVIDTLVGIAPGSALDAIRARRPAARENAQRSHEVLFAPADPGGFPVAERQALGFFVAALHGAEDLAALHAEGIARAGGPVSLRSVVRRLATEARADGPYGHYPPGPLSVENADGSIWAVPATDRATIGEHLATALEHAHLLVLHPRDATPGALRALLDAGWSPDEVVTLSQIVAFTAFQARVVAGLRILAASR